MSKEAEWCFFNCLIFFPSSRGGFLITALWMENNSLLSFSPTLILSYFLPSLSSMSPLLPLLWCWLVEDTGWVAECKRGGNCSLPVGKLTQRSVCGEDLNVAVGAMLGMRGSALPGAELEEPTSLFKEMAVGGTVDRLLCFSVCLSLSSKHLFLPSTRMVIIFIGGGWCYFHTCWERGQHMHTKQCVGGMFCVIVSAMYTLNCSPPNIWPFRAF